MTMDGAFPSFLQPSTVEAEAATDAPPPWIVVIADDEPDVHTVTRFALDGFVFEGRKLQLLHVHSGAETIDILRATPDAALLLLDVVMESDHAGLDAVRRIRDELGNRRVRIVLRTGQPGAAPEAEVIARYDINGYADKTELTKRKLETVLYSCLRSFRDIQTIESQFRQINAHRRGLERVIDASATIFKIPSFERFTDGVLDQLSALISHGGQEALPCGLYARIPGIAATNARGSFRVVAGTGPFEQSIGRDLADTVSPAVYDRIMGCLAAGQGAIGPDEYIGVFPGDIGGSKVVYLSGGSSQAVDSHMIDLFTRNVGIAFDNIELRDAIEETQREIVYRLGGAVESRSKETANHVKRVAQMSLLLAHGAGLSERDAEILYLASPLHDLGKIGIPDHILNKPAQLTPEEWAVMQTHPLIGYHLLRDSPMPILQTGALISLEHHEKWDGTGYPHGKKGQDISIEARITAVVDVFDALCSKRCYKDAWAPSEVLKHLSDNTGTHFDPDVVDLLFRNLPAIWIISNQFPD